MARTLLLTLLAMKAIRVFFLASLAAIFPALVFAKGPRQTKPPLMPTQIVSGGEVSMESGGEPERSLVRLGIQGGGYATTAGIERPTSVSEMFAGARLFSRMSLGGRWYLFPSVGFYRQLNASSESLNGPNLIELGAGLNFALFKVGPVGVLMGVSQRVGWRFFADNLGIRGSWFYRAGPAASINIRLNRSLSFLLTTELVFPLSKPFEPEWGGHAGLVFGL